MISYNCEKHFAHFKPTGKLESLEAVAHILAQPLPLIWPQFQIMMDYLDSIKIWCEFGGTLG